jgi:peptidoglycan LD-endopeptidase CwlK
MKWFKRTFFSLFLIIISIFLYYQFLTKPVAVQNVVMPDSLHPVVQEQTNQLIEKAAAKGISILITDDFRSSADQDLLFEKGRTTEGNIVTYAKGGESYHNFGLAVDFAIRIPSGGVIWDRKYDGNGNGVADWSEVVMLAKELGFEWGGDWTSFKDYPHLQMDFGLAIEDLQRGERPPEEAILVDGQ